MEDVLDLYQEPYDPARPVVCFDESPIQLIEEVREPIAARAGSTQRYDIEYKRNGAEASLTLGEAWSVRCTRELRDQLTRLVGDDRLLIHYPKYFVS